MRRDVALLFHASERDVDRSAFQSPFRGGDQLQSVQGGLPNEQVEDQRFLGRERRDAMWGRHAFYLTQCKTAVKAEPTSRLRTLG